MSALAIANWVAIGATVICAIYSALGYHRPPGSSPVTDRSHSVGRARSLILRWVPALVCVCAVAFNHYQLYNNNDQIDPQTIEDYGLGSPPANLFMTVDSSDLIQYAASYKMILVVQVRYDDIDVMTNPDIDKSAEYMITGDTITLDLVISHNTKLDFSPFGQNNIGFYLVLLPNDISPNQVETLADVTILGGKILAHRGEGFPGLVLNRTPIPNSTPSAPQ